MAKKMETTLLDVGLRDITSKMENPTEKKMENEMETGLCLGVVFSCLWLTGNKIIKQTMQLL